MIKYTPLLCLCLCLCVLNSCIKLFPDPPSNDKTILLEIKDLKLDKAQKVEWQLLVERPTAPSHLNNSLIAVNNADSTANYVENAQWADDLPDILHTVLIDAFVNSNKIIGIGRSSIGLNAKYILHIDINDFELDEHKKDEAPRILLSLTAQLMEMKNRTIIKSKTFEITRNVPYKNSKSIAETFNKGLEDILSKIVVWTLEAE